MVKFGETYAERFADRYQGSLAGIPEPTEELKNLLGKHIGTVESGQSERSFWIQQACVFLIAADSMRDRVGDGVDDRNQNMKAFQCMDIALGIAEDELSSSVEKLLEGEV